MPPSLQGSMLVVFGMGQTKMLIMKGKNEVELWGPKTLLI
jgi:hypothetical protein